MPLTILERFRVFGVQFLRDSGLLVDAEDHGGDGRFERVFD